MGSISSTEGGDPPAPFRAWSVDAVCEQLEKMGMGDFVSMCRENNINGDLALAMTKDDLEELGVTGFKQKRVLSALNPLKGEDEKLLMMAAKLKAMEAKQGAQEDEWQKHQKDKKKPKVKSSSTSSAGDSCSGEAEFGEEDNVQAKKQERKKRKQSEAPCSLQPKAAEQVHSLEISTVGHGRRLAGNKSRVVYPSGFIKNGWPFKEGDCVLLESDSDEPLMALIKSVFMTNDDDVVRLECFWFYRQHEAVKSNSNSHYRSDGERLSPCIHSMLRW
jgi:hypothetical protein